MSWAVRENNPQLLTALNKFLDDEYKQLFYNIIHKRYFENARRTRPRNATPLLGTPDASRLSPYDDIVREQAKKYGFDWYEETEEYQEVSREILRGTTLRGTVS